VQGVDVIKLSLRLRYNCPKEEISQNEKTGYNSSDNAPRSESTNISSWTMYARMVAGMFVRAAMAA
jgi:hypothetical protein